MMEGDEYGESMAEDPEAVETIMGRGLHSSTLRLNLSRS
jgi:hypothetical protein